MNVPNPQGFQAIDEKETPPAPRRKKEESVRRRLSQNAPSEQSQDTTLVVQVNDAEYRALARLAHRSGCSVEHLVARSIRSLVQE